MEKICTLKTIQPYFVMGTSRYQKKLIQRYGISHLYEFTMDLLTDRTITAIPDGCVDILIDCTQEKKSYVYGTVLQHKVIENQYGHRYFGVRFMPGVLPCQIDMKAEELIDSRVELAQVIHKQNFIQQIVEAADFEKRADIFMETYLHSLLKETRQENSSKSCLMQAMKKKIFLSGGEISVHALEEYTGYSSRYINRVFHEMLGINPKTFCRIMKFQTAIEKLNQNPLGRLTDLAAAYGYCDQAQFIHDFHQYTGTTPKAYQKKIREIHYSSRILLEKMNHFYEG